MAKTSLFQSVKNIVFEAVCKTSDCVIIDTAENQTGFQALGSYVVEVIRISDTWIQVKQPDGSFWVGRGGYTLKDCREYFRL